MSEPVEEYPQTPSIVWLAPDGRNYTVWMKHFHPAPMASSSIDHVPRDAGEWRIHFGYPGERTQHARYAGECWEAHKLTEVELREAFAARF
jgi:hypothetical protein